MIVGLTGGIGSGKSEAAKVFTELGVPVVDVDVISHALIAVGQPVLEQIASHFGEGILNQDGSLNRATLRQRVFDNPTERKALEDILHPAIHDQALQELQKHTDAPYSVLAIPLLFESQRYRDVVDRSLVIDTEESMQIFRTMQRNNLTEDTVRKIMAAQISRQDRLRHADDVINNDGTLAELREKVTCIHKKYINTCRVSN